MLHQIPHKAQPFIPSEPKSTTSLSYIFPFFKFSISFLIYKFLSSLLPSHTHFPFHSPLIQIMDFLQAPENQILVGVAVAVVAIGLGAVYLNSSKKRKGMTFFYFMLCPFWNSMLLLWFMHKGLLCLSSTCKRRSHMLFFPLWEFDVNEVVLFFQKDVIYLILVLFIKFSIGNDMKGSPYMLRKFNSVPTRSASVCVLLHGECSFRCICVASSVWFSLEWIWCELFLGLVSVNALCCWEILGY